MALGSVAESAWPSEIAELSPERVYAREEGLYIVLSSFFVTESGVFVPRSTTFTEQLRSDPSYKRLSDNVFEYQIGG